MTRFLGTRGAFLAVTATVTLVIVGVSYWVIAFVWQQARVDEVEVDDALSAIYINYLNNADQYVSAESYLAMGEYARLYPEPQNVQVLVGLDTVEITGHMLNYFSAGMGVNCTYCHSLENFAADEWDDEVAMANKAMARTHLTMTQDLNTNWLTQLPELTDQKQPSGSQIICATCHNGQPQPQTWADDLMALPDDFRLALEPDVLYSVEEIGLLNVNARRDVSLDTVQYNQYVMYHMNDSLGVGCTHCHNSRYFPSYEVPAKYYSINMLQMTQYIWNEYGDTFNGKEPSCKMCHQGAAIPPGAAISVEVMPAPLVP